MSEDCPRSGGLFSDFETVGLTKPHSDAYQSTVRGGKTYRQPGISGKGRWMVYYCCSHQHAGKTVAWVDQRDGY